MSEPALNPEQGRKLLRIAAGAGIGLVVLFALVIAFTWVAMLLSGLSLEDAPTTRYLVLNLIGSAFAGLLGGSLAAAVGRSLIPPAFLALLVLGMGTVTGGQAASAGEPGWYPFTVTLIGAIAALAGGVAVRRGGRRQGGSRSGLEPSHGAG